MLQLEEHFTPQGTFGGVDVPTRGIESMNPKKYSFSFKYLTGVFNTHHKAIKSLLFTVI